MGLLTGFPCALRFSSGLQSCHCSAAASRVKWRNTYGADIPGAATASQSVKPDCQGRTGATFLEDVAFTLGGYSCNRTSHFSRLSEVILSVTISDSDSFGDP